MGKEPEKGKKIQKECERCRMRTREDGVRTGKGEERLKKNRVVSIVKSCSRYMH